MSQQYYNQPGSSVSTVNNNHNLKKVIILQWANPSILLKIRRGMTFSKEQISKNPGTFSGHLITSEYWELKGTCLVLIECVVPSWTTTYISTTDIRSATVLYATNHRVELMDFLIPNVEACIKKYVQNNRDLALEYLSDSEGWTIEKTTPVFPRLTLAKFDEDKIKEYKPGDIQSMSNIFKVLDKKMLRTFLEGIILKALESIKDKESECDGQTTDNKDSTIDNTTSTTQ